MARMPCHFGSNRWWAESKGWEGLASIGSMPSGSFGGGSAMNRHPSGAALRGLALAGARFLLGGGTRGRQPRRLGAGGGGGLLLGLDAPLQSLHQVDHLGRLL